jgi:hypothetical protein
MPSITDVMFRIFSERSLLRDVPRCSLYRAEPASDSEAVTFHLQTIKLKTNWLVAHGLSKSIQQGRGRVRAENKG